MGADGGGGFLKGKQTPEVEASLKKMGEKALKAGAFPDGQINMGRLLQTRMWHAWGMLPQFTICLANGSAMGDGMGCVACNDFAISIKTAFFSLSDVKIGVVPASIAPYIVQKTGTGVAKRIFCTSENMSAEKAKDAGIIDEVVDSVADGHKIIKELCAQLTECGPWTVEFAKTLVLGVSGQQIAEPLMFYTSMMLAKVTSSEEYKQGLAALQM